MALYKPNSNQGPAFLSSSLGNGPPTITSSTGQVFTGKQGPAFHNEGNYKWIFPQQVLGLKGAKLSHGGDSFTLGSGSQRYEGSSLSSFAPSSSHGGSAGAGGGGMYAPNQVGQYGFSPADLTGQFPSPFLTQFNPVTYNPIQTAPYKFTDPQKFAKSFGAFQRTENTKNYAQAKNLALDTLDTELGSLKNYSSAAGALKRNETSVDNTFNQQQRTSQLASALPGATDDLARQEADARAYASGRPPDDVTNQALELNVRSAAADRANAGGFGAASSVARKTSDLMSADQRINLSQYGEGLLSSNVNQRAGLELAPTEYANVGSQINVNPPVSASQLISSNLGLISQLGSIPATTALGSTTQQNQFSTGLEQQTRQFNASNQLQSGEFNSSGEFQQSATNAGIQNSFALDKFGYQVGLAGANAGAAQTNANTGIAVQQQAQAQQNFQSALGATQDSQNVGALFNAIGAGSKLFGGSGDSSGGGGSSGGGSSGGDGSFINGGGSGSGISGINGGGDSSGVPPFQLDPTGSSGSSPQYTLPPSSSGVGNTGPSNVGGGSTNIGGDNTSGGGSDLGNSSTGGDGSSIGGDFSGLDAQFASRAANFQSTTGINLRSVGVSPGQATGSPGSPTVGDLVSHGSDTLSAAGIHDTPQPNTTQVAVDNGGNPVYSSVPLLRSADIKSGSNAINGLQSTVQPMGALSEEDLNSLNKIGGVASDPDTLANLDHKIQTNDSKGFIDTALQSMGFKTTDQLSKDSGKDKNATLQGVSAAYSASQLQSNWGHMSPAQKTLGLAAMGAQGYRTKEGTSLTEAPVVKPVVDSSGKTVSPGMKVGEGLQLLKDGYNVYPLIKQWDQVNTLQKVLGGNGDHKQLASLAQSMGMLGYGPDGAAVPNVTPESLNKIGAKPTPQFGVGAVAIPANQQVPQGYGTVTRKADGTTIAIPNANKDTATAGLTNTAAGTSSAGEGATNTYKNWGTVGVPNSNAGSNGGNAAVGGLTRLAQTNPYALGGVVTAGMVTHTVQARKASQSLNDVQAGANATRDVANATGNGSSAIGQGAGNVATGIGAFNTVKTLTDPKATNTQKAEAIGTTAASAFGGPAGAIASGAVNTYNIANSNASGNQKATAIRQGAENTAAAYYTFGLSSVAQYADQRFLGGKGQAIRNKLDSVNPVSIVEDKVLGKVLDFTSSGKSSDQQARDAVRTGYQHSGLLDKDYQVTLADGSKANLGVDGHGDQHGATDSNVLKGNLKSYETDYTNDLDVVAGMGGTTLSRILAGGSSKGVDQMGGQLGNASLSQVGYNKPLTPENYQAVMQNQRAMYAQSGIKSQSDAYQLINQAYGDKRLNETQLVTAKQSVDLIFGNNTFDQAQKLMAGRSAGVEAASNLGSANGASTPTVVQNTLSPQSSVPNQPVPQKVTQRVAPISMQDIIAKNRQRYGAPAAQVGA